MTEHDEMTKELTEDFTRQLLLALGEALEAITVAIKMSDNRDKLSDLAKLTDVVTNKYTYIMIWGTKADGWDVDNLISLDEQFMLANALGMLSSLKLTRGLDHEAPIKAREILVPAGKSWVH